MHALHWLNIESQIISFRVSLQLIVWVHKLIPRMAVHGYSLFQATVQVGGYYSNCIFKFPSTAIADDLTFLISVSLFSFFQSFLWNQFIRYLILKTACMNLKNMDYNYNYVVSHRATSILVAGMQTNVVKK